jgi:hypothetical protein
MQIITSGQQDGDLGVFFSDDGCLSEEMIRHNNLSSDPDQNADKKTKGYIGKNGRIRAQNFRGEKSYGLWLPLGSIGWAGPDTAITIAEGACFTELNGHDVCRKYVNPATLRQAEHRKRMQAQRRTFKMLKQHQDTKQLRYNLGKIPLGAIIYLTEKVHGTSGRTGHVLADELVKGWRAAWNRLLGWLYTFKPRKSWMYVTGSRRVNLDPDATEESGFYSGKTFRVDIHKRLKELTLPKGVTLFYEIVGYDEGGGAIMHAPSVDKIGDSKLRKQVKAQYGSTMRYSYGCNPEDPDTEKRYRVLVYHATMTNVDGVSEDLPWPRVKTMCSELGLECVPDLEMRFSPQHRTTTRTAARLLKAVEQYLDNPSGLDQSHLSEGVVVRVESGDGVRFYKDKGYLFKVLEGIVKDNPDVVDMEEGS